jgi:hypothetical protein
VAPDRPRSAQRREPGRDGRSSLEICREIGDRPHEAETLVHIGELEQAAGNVDGARRAWRASLVIRIEIGHPEVASLRAMIDGL